MFNLNEGLIYYLDGKFTEPWQLTATFIAFVVITMVASYLLGSINSAIVISKLIYRDDVRKHGSGNAGMTNMLRTYGGKAALLTLFGDMLKTAIAVFIAGALLGFRYSYGVSYNDGYCYMAGLFAVLGHIFPIYYGFKGGKGVLVTATMGLIVSPIPFLIVLTIFVIVVAVSKYVSLGSVIGAILYPIILNGYCQVFFGATPGIMMLCVILLAIIIVFCHRANLERISNRTENKLSFKKKAAPASEEPEASIEGEDE